MELRVELVAAVLPRVVVETDNAVVKSDLMTDPEKKRFADHLRDIANKLDPPEEGE